MELETRVMDQFVNEEGSEQEKDCWGKIRSAMCEANSNAVLGEVLALETEDFHTEEDWIRKEDVLNILGKYFS